MHVRASLGMWIPLACACCYITDRWIGANRLAGLVRIRVPLCDRSCRQIVDTEGPGLWLAVVAHARDHTIAAGMGEGDVEREAEEDRLDGAGGQRGRGGDVELALLTE